VCPVVSRIARAQTYPSRPVRIVVPFDPGSPGDLAARLMGQRLSERLDQPFIVENWPGAGGNIGTEAVVKAPADGYTLLLVAASSTINVTLYEKLNFDFLRDLTPIAGIISIPFVVAVNLSVPANTISDLIAYAKANPGKLKMASGGNGTTGHLSGELFKMMAGVNMVHVPYRGADPALNDLLDGQVQVLFGSMPASIEHIRAGKLRALAITTPTRSGPLPDLPTVGEFVPNYEASTWDGLSAPRNTPAEIINKLNNEIDVALADPAIRSRIADLGSVPMPMTAGDFGKFIAAETEKWGKVIRAANIKPVIVRAP